MTCWRSGIALTAIIVLLMNGVRVRRRSHGATDSRRLYEVHWDEESTSLGLYEAKDLEDYGWHTGAVVVPTDEFKKAFGKP